MNLIKKISALMLAVLVLLSTFSFNISMHYCQKSFKHVSLFGPAESCHDNNVVADCESKSETKSCCHAKKEQEETPDKKDNCCHNKDFVIEGQNPETTLANGIDIKPSEHEVLFQVSYQLAYNLTPFLPLIEKYKHRIYKPPLVTTDILLFNQSFLI
jgi:hypothetical protein